MRTFSSFSSPWIVPRQSCSSFAISFREKLVPSREVAIGRHRAGTAAGGYQLVSVV
jgi:hypothetical protein